MNQEKKIFIKLNKLGFQDTEMLVAFTQVLYKIFDDNGGKNTIISNYRGYVDSNQTHLIDTKNPQVMFKFRFERFVMHIILK